MARKSDIEAGRAFVRLFLKDDLTRQLAKAVKKAGQSLVRIGTPLAAAGAAITAPLAAAVKSFASIGDDLDKMALRTGIAASSLAELSFAAEQSGASIGNVEGAVLKMNRRFGRVTAGQGTAGQVAAIKELGMSVEELTAMNPEQRFMRFAKAIREYGDNAAAAGLAQRVLGTSVDALMPLFQSDIGGLRGEAQGLGLTPSDEDVANAAKVTDAMNRIRRVLKQMVFDVGAALAGPIMEGLEVVKNVGVAFGEWIRNNKSLIQTLAAVGAGLLAAGTAIVAIGTGLMGFGAALASIASIMGLLFSPAGLLAAGVAAWAMWTKSGQNAVRSITSLFGKLLKIGKEVLGGVVDALKSGNLERAGKIAFAGLKLAAIEGLEAIKSLVGEDVTAIAGYFLNGDIEGAFSHLILTLGGLWESFTGMTTEAWVGAIKVVREHWQSAVTGVAKGLAWLASQPGFNEISGEADADRRYQEQNVQRMTAIKKSMAEWQEIIDANAEGRKAKIRGEELVATDADAENARNKLVELEKERQRLGTGHGSRKRQGLDDLFSGIDDDHSERISKLDEFEKKLNAIMGMSKKKSREGGVSALSDAAKAAREELDRLKAEGVTGGGGGGGGGGIGGGGIGGGGGRSGLIGGTGTVTFSAAAAIASGFGAKGENPVVRELVKSQDLYRQMIAKGKETVSAVTRVGGMLADVAAGLTWR